MNLWLDTASQEKINVSIKNPVDSNLLEKHLDKNFIQTLCKYTKDNQLFCMGLSDHLPYYEKLTPGDELLLTITGDKSFRYYAQVSGKAKSRALVSELWPFQKGTNIVYIYFITNIREINIQKTEIFSRLGLKNKTLAEAIPIDKHNYLRYGKAYERLNLNITEYNFPTSLSLDLEPSNLSKKSQEMPIKEGDIILTFGKHPVSKKIIKLQNIIAKFRKKPATEYSHISLGIADGVAIEATRVESSSVRFIAYDELLLKRSKKFKIYRKSTIEQSLVKSAKLQYGKEYPNLPFSLIKGVLEILFLKYYKQEEKYYKTEPYQLEEDSYAFCSSLVADILREENMIGLSTQEKSHLLSPADLEHIIQNNPEWEDISIESQLLLENNKEKNYNKSTTANTIKNFVEYSEQESIDNQIREWDNSYPLPNNIPIWEQLKIYARIRDKSYNSYKSQKKYTDFLKGRNS